MKIAHLTSAHTRYDIRIFIKMCVSLAKDKRFDVNLISADGLGKDVKENVTIHDAGAKSGSRISRMTKTVDNVYKKALEIDCDVYHLHDPELIPVGLKLKKLGKKVIFDAHEDLPKQLKSKPYLNKTLRFILSNLFSLYEKYSCRKFDYIVTATPNIRDKFLNINKNSIDINNFPILGELSISNESYTKKNEVCYVGGISEIRGIKEVINALEYLDGIKLNLVGKFNNKTLEEEVKTYPGWKKVNHLGFLERDEVADVMGRSKAGIVTFHPLPNHVDAQPNKMFEYMSAKLPIITSNFPLWREIVDGNSCGTCVDPLDSKQIAQAIKEIVDNELKADELAKNGEKAVLSKYNWDIEEQKLYKIYEDIIK
ncbi:glycosyltransferase [Poseidonibacter ostreae]|uniref:Glycosyltransferase n=1 Tax=Poseidonibacter ostreae TaxID=2654171 RepID=A0A6L4WUH8_9BACT|nr:glycosyltransferase [Poseidonibacter ostreae]KAB7890223.1 glycosyltransferase [Poseidonibacter ostreae]